MAEDFNNFLTFDHFFDVAVNCTNCSLLAFEGSCRASTDGFNDIENYEEHCYDEQGQQWADDQHHRKSTYNSYRRSNDVGQATGDHFTNNVNVVGVAAHQFAVGVSIEVGDWQILHLLEQVAANGIKGAVGDGYHQAVDNIVGNNAGQVHTTEEGQCLQQTREVSISLTDEWNNVIVDQRFQHVGTDDTCSGADHQTECYDQKQPFAAFQIRKDADQRFQWVSWFLETMTWWRH